jgi:hypothetical protein
MSETVAIDLPAEPESAPQARKQLEVFRTSLDEVSFVDLCLLVDELVVRRSGTATEPRASPSSCGRSATATVSASRSQRGVGLSSFRRDAPSPGIPASGCFSFSG